MHGRYSLVLANPVVTSVLRGASRADQLTDSLSSIEVRLDHTVKRRLDYLSKSIAKAMRVPNRGLIELSSSGNLKLSKKPLHARIHKEIDHESSRDFTIRNTT